jgi:putative heme degradation protein
MNPDTIELFNLTKSFEYIKFSNQIDSINDIEDLRNLTKCYFKLYLKQQEIVSDWSVSKP